MDEILYKELDISPDKLFSLRQMVSRTLSWARESGIVPVKLLTSRRNSRSLVRLPRLGVTREVI